MVVGKKHHFSIENAKNVHQAKLYTPSTIQTQMELYFFVSEQNWLSHSRQDPSKILALKYTFWGKDRLNLYNQL